MPSNNKIWWCWKVDLNVSSFNPKANIVIFHPFGKHISLLCYHCSENSWCCYQVFHDGGFFIKSLFKIFGFLLRRFYFQHGSLINKGKGPQVISEILMSLHVLWQELINFTKEVASLATFSSTVTAKKSHKFDISINLNVRFLTRNEEKSVFWPWKWWVGLYTLTLIWYIHCL